MNEVVMLAAVVMASALVISARLIMRQLTPVRAGAHPPPATTKGREKTEVEKALDELKAKVAELEARESPAAGPAPPSRSAGLRQEVIRLTALGLSPSQIGQRVAARPSEIDLLIRVNQLCAPAPAVLSPGPSQQPVPAGLLNSSSTPLAELR
jgi:hypothetical protein